MSSNEQVARRRAEAFRAEHDLGVRPLGDLFELVHAALGRDAFAFDVDDAEHGLLMGDPETNRVCIVVATTSHPMRQRSSLAHEIGHLAAGDLEATTMPTPGTRGTSEIQADAFARHLLLPLPALEARFGPRGRGAPVISEADLAAIVQQFELSPQSAAIQLKEAGLITAATCKEWGALTTPLLAARYGWLSQYKAMSLVSAQARAPQRLMHKAVEGYRRGVLGVGELAMWYAMSPTEVVERLEPAEQMRPATTNAQASDALDEDAPLFPPGVGVSRAPVS